MTPDPLRPGDTQRPIVLRCAVTGNPCGTDTWSKGVECQCAHCQAWLHPITGPFAEIVTAARRKMAAWPEDRRRAVQLQGNPRYAR